MSCPYYTGFIVALSSSFSLLHAQTYLADGVDLVNPEASNQFYDSGKGKFWYSSYDQYKAVTALLEAGHSMESILGDLYDRRTDDAKPTANSAEYYKNLRYDSLSCWNQTGANTIEYWQQYYGVFAQKEAVSGNTYNPDFRDELAGAQSLDLNLLFYDNFLNKTSSQAMAAEWYLAGSKGYGTSSILKTGVTAEDGGYFAKYFPSIDEVSDFSSSTNLISFNYVLDTNQLADKLAEALGYEKKGNAYSRLVKGQLAALNLTPTSGTAHVVTCYGFEMTDTEGVLALYVADSDDQSYELVKVYAKRVNGKFMLYSDEATQVFWETYGKSEWSLTSTSYIDTPDSLIALEASYNKATTKQVWSAGSSEWGGTDPNDDGGVPTASSGWMRYADIDGTEFDGYFASEYDSERDVVFNDANQQAGETQRSVTLAKAVTAPNIEVANDAIAYRFEGNTHSITATSLKKTGSQELHIRNTQLKINDVTISEGSFVSEDNTITGDLTIESGASLQIVGSNSVSGDVVLASGSEFGFTEADSSLDVAGNLVLHAGVTACAESVLGIIVLGGELHVKAALQTRMLTNSAEIGATLDLRAADGITMESSLRFVNGAQLILSEDTPITLTLQGDSLINENQQLVLFEGLDSLMIGDTIVTESSQWLLADYFNVDATALGVSEDSNLVYDSTTGNFFIEADVVPEPSSASLALLGLAGALLRRRRKS